MKGEFPSWTLDGRAYKTVSGLCNALTKKHGAESVSMVRSDRSLSVYGKGGGEIARYYVDAPQPGKAMVLRISHTRTEPAPC